MLLFRLQGAEKITAPLILQWPGWQPLLHSGFVAGVEIQPSRASKEEKKDGEKEREKSVDDNVKERKSLQKVPPYWAAHPSQ